MKVSWDNQLRLNYVNWAFLKTAGKTYKVEKIPHFGMALKYSRPMFCYPMINIKGE